MTFGMYSIRDSLTGFMTPVLEQNDAAALRNFQMACDTYPKDSGKSLMRWKPADFSLFKIGYFDSDSGLLTSITPPAYIAGGLSVRAGESPKLDDDPKEVDDYIV